MKFPLITTFLSLGVSLLPADRLVREGDPGLKQNLGGPDARDPQGDDLLRFTNGDVIHGSFSGYSEATLSWQRSDLAVPLALKTNHLNQLAFNGGRTEQSLPPSAYVSLRNGDRVPGTIVSLDDDELVLESPMAGKLLIRRAMLSKMTPSPQGGPLVYAGPFNSENWLSLVNQELPADRAGAQEPQAKVNPNPNRERNEEEPAAEPKRPWIHAGAAWYSTKNDPIVLQTPLPEQARITFKLAWRNQLNTTIAFHASMRRPMLDEQGNLVQEPLPEGENEEDEEKKAEVKWESVNDLEAKDQLLAWLEARHRNSHARTYGSSYVINFYATHPTLYRCSFSADGQAQVETVRSRWNQFNLNESHEAEFDLRIDRPNNLFSLYINGQYVMQWEDPAGYAGLGDFLAFSPNANCRLRISDLVISSWNGMTDSARSMRHRERDIVLLTNGTDRFSGNVTRINNGVLSLETAYTSLEIPLADIQEIHFHEDDQTAEPEEVRDQPILHYHPYGRLTLNVLSATREQMHAHSSVLGELKLDLVPATLLEFRPGNPALDGWDESF